MNRVRNIHLLSVILILAAFAVSCGEQQKANKLVDEGNAAVTEAEKIATDADNKLNQLIAGATEFPQGRDKLKAPSQEILGMLDKAIAKLREAEKKFADASKLDV